MKDYFTTRLMQPNKWDSVSLMNCMVINEY